MRISLPFFFVRVRGESMWPERIPGNRYLGTTLLSPKVGRTVLARTRTDGFVIKRVADQVGDEFVLKGAVSWATAFTVARKDILGVVF